MPRFLTIWQRIDGQAVWLAACVTIAWYERRLGSAFMFVMWLSYHLLHDGLRLQNGLLTPTPPPFYRPSDLLRRALGHWPEAAMFRDGGAREAAYEGVVQVVREGAGRAAAAVLILAALSGPLVIGLLKTRLVVYGLLKWASIGCVLLFIGWPVWQVLGVWLFRRAARRELRRRLAALGVPVCVPCGYDLRGSPGPACPECGAAFDVTLLGATATEQASEGEGQAVGNRLKTG